MDVSDDGSLVAIANKSGALSVYLTRLPMLAAAYKNFIAILSSLTEISVYENGLSVRLF